MADPATKAAAIAIAAGAGGVILPGVLDLDVAVVIAGFAGAAGILSFLPPAPLLRMAGTVLFCASAGIFSAGIAARELAWLGGAKPLAALAIGALLQLLVPWLIDNRGQLGERLLALIGRRPDPPKGGP